ncbi:PMSR-domain-containing protein [Jaminaea rosea]|uniref:peptide-methionine (S)-S-oxide reductase n=1 Tax=Jaminaea rosea TaxID=1569628 RepID=A0A316UWR8_9BASI|nr:PMSR-domain-containing protein [Jaminaea rosea]PWN29746.1 PMSR-domain-containing protein [Jaminaea rosea]
MRPSPPTPRHNIAFWTLSLAAFPISYYMFTRFFRPSLKPAKVLGNPTTPTTATALAASASTMSSAGDHQVFTGANGCFWGPAQMYTKHFKNKGLISQKVGYIGGHTANPTYRDVCSGRTGHAEAIQVTFDPSKVSYAELVEFLYRTHDPTTKDRQGADVGSQYRSAIFPHNDEQKEIVERITKEVQEKHFTPNGRKIVTTIEPAKQEDFVEAEEYHQDYLDLNPSGYHCSTHRLYW